MTGIAITAAALASFLMGFIIGSFREPPEKKALRTQKEAYKAATERLQQEYRNFLNYDGAPQE